MAEPTTFRLDPESEMILNQICSQKYLTKSEAIRFVLKNTDMGFEGEKFKKLEQMHTKLLSIFSDVHKQNSTILKTLQENNFEKTQQVVLNDNNSQVNDKLEDDLKKVGNLIRGAQSIELIRAIKSEVPDFYDKFIKIQ